MSTKTLRKRIALVAVSALGFGLISAAPSSAADRAAVSVASVTVAPVRAGDAKNVTVKLNYGATGSTFTAADTATAGSVVRAIILSGPTVATTAPSLGSAVVTSSAITTFAATLNSTADRATISPTLSITPNNAGTYTLLVWVDESGTGGGNDTLAGVADVQSTVTFTTAGAPASVVFDSVAKTGTMGLTNAGTFDFTLLDAAGKATYLKSALGESLSGSVTDVSPNTTGGVIGVIDGTTATVVDATTKSITTDALGVGAISVGTTTAGIARARIIGSGMLTGLVPAVTADFTTVNYSAATVFELTTSKGVNPTGAAVTAPAAFASAFPVLTSGADDSIWASNVSAKALTFKVTSSATAAVIQYTIAAASPTTALPTGVTAGTYSVTTANTGTASAPVYTASFTITATAAIAASGYTVSVSNNGVSTYTVAYAAPTVNQTNGYVVTSPTSANAAKTLIAGSATVSATVRDQFGDVFSGANVIWTVTGRNASTAAGTSNASGVATYTITDASVSTTALKDTIKVTAASPTATTYTLSTDNSASAETAFNYVATMVVTTLTHTNGAVSATAIAAGSTPTAPDASVTLTATAKDALGVLMSGIPVTFTLPAGAYVATAGTSLTQYTDNVGVATLAIKSTLTGTNTASATAGGATATSAYTIANVATDGRVITIDKADLSVSAASAGQVTITLKDRYGNLVGGADFSVAYIGTAGRVSAVNGVVAAGGKTGALTGTATVDLSSNSAEAGTGTLAVTVTTPDASTSTLMGNGAAYTTQVKSVTSAITVGASKSAEIIAIEAIAAKAAADKAESDAKIALLQAALDAAATKAAADKLALEAAIAASQAAAVAASEAAADAAAEAIDAGNNAFDAATSAGEAADAATAAAEQAGEDATAAAVAAGEAAVAAAEAAQEAAAEATDAANAATDAANASAEAADAATAAAQDAADAVAALSVQVTEVIATLKKQITALTNLVIRIQKKVKA